MYDAYLPQEVIEMLEKVYSSQLARGPVSMADEAESHSLVRSTSVAPSVRRAARSRTEGAAEVERTKMKQENDKD